MNIARLLFCWLIICLLHNNCFAQKMIDTTDFAKLQNRAYLPYKKSNGNFLGCGYTYECTGMRVAYDSIIINKRLSKIRIKGMILAPARNSDTFGVCAVSIYLAKPVKNKLNQVRRIMTTCVLSKVGRVDTMDDALNGRFLMDIKFGPKDRLYFEHVAYAPIEINIGKLLQ